MIRSLIKFLSILVIGIAASTIQGASGLTSQQAAYVHDGEKAFLAGNYQEAARIYERLISHAPYDPAALYNLATAYARDGQKGMAIWRLLQAMELAPRNPEIRHNLNALAPDLSQQIAMSPIPPVNWLYQHFTGNEWAMAAGISAGGAMLLAAFYCWQARRRPGVRWMARGLILPLLIIAAIAYPLAMVHFYNEDMTWRGVVVAEGTVARTGPSENQIETDTLPVGTVVHILENTLTGWIKFSYAGGRMGFVEASRVQSL